MENGIGIKKTENKYEKVFKDSAVRINSGPQSALGILNKVEGYTFYLSPAIVYQNLAKDKVLDWKYNPLIKKDRPVMFEVAPPFTIEPVDKNYLEDLVKSYKNWETKAKSKK